MPTVWLTGEASVLADSGELRSQEAEAEEERRGGQAWALERKGVSASRGHTGLPHSSPTIYWCKGKV